MTSFISCSSSVPSLCFYPPFFPFHAFFHTSIFLKFLSATPFLPVYPLSFKHFPFFFHYFPSFFTCFPPFLSSPHPSLHLLTSFLLFPVAHSFFIFPSSPPPPQSPTFTVSLLLPQLTRLSYSYSASLSHALSRSPPLAPPFLSRRSLAVLCGPTDHLSPLFP